MCRNGKARLLCCEAAEDGMGRIWRVNTRSGNLLRGAATGRTATERSRLYMDTNGRLWYYDLHESHLYRLNEDAATWNDHSAEGLLAGKMMTDVMDDGDGNLWIGTDNNGIFWMDGGTGRVTAIGPGPGGASFTLTDNHVACFYKDDAQATMWVGMSKQGVVFCNLAQPAISQLPMPDKEDVSCITEDGSGRLWLGFDSQGIGQLAGGDVVNRVRAADGSISSNQVVCSFIDSQGRHWWGSYGGSLYYMKEGQVHLIPDNRLNYVAAICEDGMGNLWFATSFEGLYCMHPDGQVDAYRMENSALSTNSLTDVKVQGGKVLFVGTSNGLYRFDIGSGQFRQLSREHIKALLVDSRQQLWIGMRDGLAVKDLKRPGAKIKVLNTENGLSHNYVLGLAEDRFGNVWVSTMGGVTKVQTTRAGRTYRLISYYEYDGLGKPAFNQHAIACLRNGDILVGGIGSVVRIVPDEKVHTRANTCPVRFTGLTISGRRIEAGSKTDDGRVLLKKNILLTTDLTLSYSDTNIGIEVSSVNYLDQPHEHYVYRLGNQERWNRMEGGTVVLNKLTPGHYQQQVKVEETDATYQNPVGTLAIRVTPPFWQSAGAYALYALAAVGLVLLGIFYFHRRSKQKLLQQRRELRAQQREEMNEAKMRFFTNISHDLRTPLSLIITPVERMLRGELPEGVRSQLELVGRNASLLMEDITQLLDFRKLDESLDIPSLQPSSLRGFVEEAARQFVGAALPGDVTLELDLANDALPVDMDQTKMRRVLFNLVSNAIKYNVAGGKVTVSTRREGDWAVLAVTDTGIGVKNKERVFERFYQEHQSGETTYIGSGIGLHMVKQYVVMHGGTVHVSDNQPQGTVFTVRLPLLAQTPTPALSLDGEKEPAGSQPTHREDARSDEGRALPILIVEDNTDFRSFLHSCLADRYQVLEAANGQEALEVLQGGADVRLIISDVMMPVMDGYALCRKVKADMDFSHIPFIMLTARTADEHQIGGLSEGADDYIAKPFNLDILLLRISRLLRWTQEAKERFRKMEVSPSEITVSNVDEQLISRAISLVEQHIGEPEYSVEQLCDEMGMSRSSVYKKLVAITGLSPIHFMRTIRVKRGRQLLEQSGEVVSQVAYRIGLSPKQFAKYFKEEYGISPSELNRRHGHTGENLHIS